MSPSFALDPYLAGVAARVEGELRRAAEAGARGGPARLWEAMSYALLGGGKRLRPALVCATAEAFGADTGDGSLAIRFAASLEMIHTYSLVHDDLPCMDDDDLRRGRPTVHLAFDEATAVLAGDALQSLAFEHLLAGPTAATGGPARRAARLGRHPHGRGAVARPRGRDPAPDLEGVLDLQRRKTGALLAASVVGGAIAATGTDQGLGPAGLKLGLAFQIADDLLDLTADTADLGKRAGKDAAAGKATLPALLGVGGSAGARRRLL